MFVRYRMTNESSNKCKIEYMIMYEHCMIYVTLLCSLSLVPLDRGTHGIFFTRFIMYIYIKCNILIHIFCKESSPVFILWNRADRWRYKTLGGIWCFKRRGRVVTKFLHVRLLIINFCGNFELLSATEKVLNAYLKMKKKKRDEKNFRDRFYLKFSYSYLYSNI